MRTQESDMTTFGLVSIAGEQAKKFLQGQLTCNLDEVTASRPTLGAHCNPQGRVISFFLLFFHDDRYYLQMPRALIPIAMQALQKYAVFFKVTLTDVSDTFNPSAMLKNLPTMKLSEGIPAIYPETSEKFLPHELNLPALGAVSFNKGCYTGQEIIARMQYRGKLKNHLYRAIVDSPLVLTRGADIYSEGKSCGTLVDYCQTENNRYELLVIANEKDKETGTLTVDSDKKYKLLISE